MTIVAALLFCSGALLLYTAIVAPVQIFLWDFNDEICNPFPTLYLDLFVDVFFLVRFGMIRCDLEWFINSKENGYSKTDFFFGTKSD